MWAYKMGLIYTYGKHLRIINLSIVNIKISFGGKK